MVDLHTYKWDDEAIATLEKLAALGYQEESIALYFDFDIRLFTQMADDTETDVHRHIKRGRLFAAANPDIQLFAAAESGNITAIQQLAKRMKEKRYDDLVGSIDEF